MDMQLRCRFGWVCSEDVDLDGHAVRLLIWYAGLYDYAVRLLMLVGM